LEYLCENLTKFKVIQENRKKLLDEKIQLLKSCDTVSLNVRMVSDSESSSVGKESQFETLYEQDFQALRQECLKSGKLFEDLEFLPREEFLRKIPEIQYIPYPISSF